MALISITDVLAIAPELSEVPQETRDRVLGWVNADLNVSAWGSEARAARAGCYLAAHLLTLSKPGGAGGKAELQSITVGAVSKSYAVSSEKGALSSTGYGREYARLLSVTPGRWLVL